jgi:hypothetical protein
MAWFAVRPAWPSSRTESGFRNASTERYVCASSGSEIVSIRTGWQKLQSGVLARNAWRSGSGPAEHSGRCHDILIRRFCESALRQTHSVYAAQLRLRVACRKKTGARLSTALVRLFSRAIMTSKLSKAQKDSVKALASITESTCVTFLRAVPTQSTSVSAHTLVSSRLSARSTHWKC